MITLYNLYTYEMMEVIFNIGSEAIYKVSAGRFYTKISNFIRYKYIYVKQSESLL